MTKPGQFIKTLPTSPRLPPLRVVRIPTRGVEEEEPIISAMQLDGLAQDHPARLDAQVFEVVRWHLMTGSVCLLVPWDADVHRSPFQPTTAPMSTRVDTQGIDRHLDIAGPCAQPFRDALNNLLCTVCYSRPRTGYRLIGKLNKPNAASRKKGLHIGAMVEIPNWTSPGVVMGFNKYGDPVCIESAQVHDPKEVNVVTYWAPNKITPSEP